MRTPKFSISISEKSWLFPRHVERFLLDNQRRKFRIRTYIIPTLNRKAFVGVRNAHELVKQLKLLECGVRKVFLLPKNVMPIMAR